MCAYVRVGAHQPSNLGQKPHDLGQYVRLCACMPALQPLPPSSHQKNLAKINRAEEPGQN